MHMQFKQILTATFAIVTSQGNSRNCRLRRLNLSKLLCCTFIQNLVYTHCLLKLYLSTLEGSRDDDYDSHNLQIKHTVLLPIKGGRRNLVLVIPQAETGQNSRTCLLLRGSLWWILASSSKLTLFKFFMMLICLKRYERMRVLARWSLFMPDMYDLTLHVTPREYQDPDWPGGESHFVIDYKFSDENMWPRY